ncbi:MAG: 50S ribosomal protein L2 [Bacteriovoracaceae bacterium]|nr:50S ribosomal protein L2 [Bacteriovoracaceae bacterium]
MALRKFKPTTPGVRGMVVQSSRTFSGDSAPKSLKESKSKILGRNNQGRITSRHRSGGNKRQYRLIDFKRDKTGIVGIVKGIHYDPNRTAHIALVSYLDGDKRYILSPIGMNIGDKITSSNEADIKVGNAKQLREIPVGTLVHAVELYPGSGAQVARSAGAYAQIMARELGHVLLRLPSGELRKFPESCVATIGQVGNLEHELISIGKAGKSRHRGWRPSVRGVAMNPIDHPHGGGEGRTSGGRHPVTPWGMSTKGFKTRKNKRTNKFIVKRRK